MIVDLRRAATVKCPASQLGPHPRVAARRASYYEVLHEESLFKSKNGFSALYRASNNLRDRSISEFGVEGVSAMV